MNVLMEHTQITPAHPNARSVMLVLYVLLDQQALMMSNVQLDIFVKKELHYQQNNHVQKEHMIELTPRQQVA